VTRLLRISQPASEELTDAVRWYEGRRAGLGGDFFDAISAMLALIEANPEIGSTISADNATQRVLVPRFPYQIVYRLMPAAMVIVAIAHLKRRPGYWKNRG